MKIAFDVGSTMFILWYNYISVCLPGPKDQCVISKSTGFQWTSTDFAADNIKTIING